MAEAAVGFAIDKLIPLLAEEANLLRSVHTEVAGIKLELESIRCFLKDADTRAESVDQEDQISSIDGVKAWVRELREPAFQIEDIVGEYTLRIYNLAARKHHPHHHGFVIVDFLKKLYCFVIELKLQCDIALQIQEIKACIRNSKERSVTYGFKIDFLRQGSMRTCRNDPRKAARFLKEDEVVGLESPKDELVGWLTCGKPQRTVISVVGMGGLGKTTLVQQVYDRVKGQFDCHAWISVSQSYKIEELLRNLMKKFCESKTEFAPRGIDEMDVETLTARLREYLHEKHYLVVLDDVWKKKVWGDLQHALLDNNKVGRIVITTRKMNIADFCKTSSFVHVHKLQPLAPKQAWELFCKKVFKFEFEGRCPPELEKLSAEIVERCKGLPLAIVTIAGLLSTRDKTVEEWRKLHGSLNSELMNKNSDLESITRILSLSYND